MYVISEMLIEIANVEFNGYSAPWEKFLSSSIFHRPQSHKHKLFSSGTCEDKRNYGSIVSSEDPLSERNVKTHYVSWMTNIGLRFLHRVVYQLFYISTSIDIYSWWLMPVVNVLGIKNKKIGIVHSIP